MIVKDYQALLHDRMFDELFSRVEKAPFVARNLERGLRSSVPQLLGLKILYANRLKLASLALATVVLINGVPIITNGISNIHQQVDTSKEVVEVVEEKQNFVEFYEDVDDRTQEVEELASDMEFENRLEETISLKQEYGGVYDTSRIMLGARVNEETIRSIFSTSRGGELIDIGLEYGIDPYLLIAKGMTESNLEHEACCPGGSKFNGYGVGAFQLESPDGRIVSAWNFKTGTEDHMKVTMENAEDFHKNAQMAAMYLQNRLNLYHGNIYLALQSYNYGVAMMKLVIHDYAKQQGITEEEVMKNLNDLGWLEIVKDIHENPNDYYYRVTLDLDETNPDIIAQAKNDYVWKHKTYGNDHYVADVLSYYVGLKSQNRSMNGTSVVTNFENNEVILLTEAETNKTVGSFFA